MNPQPTDATSPHPTWEERRGWLLFSEAKFPNYQRFWQTFVVPRTKHAKYYTSDLNILDDVPEQERRIIALNYHVFTDLYYVYRSLEKKQGTPSRERWDFRTSVSHLAAACDRIDSLLFTLLRVTNELPVSDPVRQAYDQRIADHKAAVEIAYAPYKGHLHGDEAPPRVPHIPVLLPTELAVIRAYFDLTAFDLLATQMHHNKEAIKTLRTSYPRYWYKDYDKLIAPKIKTEEGKASEQAIVEATQAALQTILADHPTLRDPTKELVDSLTAEINKIWGQQILPLLAKHPDLLQNTPQK